VTKIGQMTDELKALHGFTHATFVITDRDNFHSLLP